MEQASCFPRACSEVFYGQRFKALDLSHSSSGHPPEGNRLPALCRQEEEEGEPTICLSPFTALGLAQFRIICGYSRGPSKDRNCSTSLVCLPGPTSHLCAA